MHMVSLRATSILLVCRLLHNPGAAYSATLYTSANALVRSVDPFAPNVVPAKHLRGLPCHY